MDTPRLTSPHLHIVMADGSETDVQTLNADLIRYDLTRAKHNWPEGTKAPFLWLTFIGWAALRREHVLPDDVTWERFSSELCVSCTSADDEAEPDDDGQQGLPFPPGVGRD
jgi:hypothetical protein